MISRGIFLCMEQPHLCKYSVGGDWGRIPLHLKYCTSLPLSLLIVLPILPYLVASFLPFRIISQVWVETTFSMSRYLHRPLYREQGGRDCSEKQGVGAERGVGSSIKLPSQLTSSSQRLGHRTDTQ